MTTLLKDLNLSYTRGVFGGRYNSGIACTSLEVAIPYAKSQFKTGNRIRVKNACESDGQGQQTVETIDQLTEAFSDLCASEHGAILMPHLETILDRISVGRIALGSLGTFNYFGREEVFLREGVQVYGGTRLGLFSSSSANSGRLVEDRLEISPELAKLGLHALIKYSKLVLKMGRVSVDVLSGLTDNGTKLGVVVDITPRVGGATPAEVLAIREVQEKKGAICFASSRLLYNPKLKPTTGVNFVDTSTLIINGTVEETLS